MLIRTIIEGLFVTLAIWGLRHEDFLIKFERACWIHFKRWVKSL